MTANPASKPPEPSRATSGSASSAPRPRDFLDSACGRADALLELLTTSRVGYDAAPWAAVERELEDVLGAPDATDATSAGILAEPALERVESRTRRLLEDIEFEDPFLRRWAADSVLARCCYLVCRLSKPEIVVETGVAYGVSSAFILTALEENGRGALHSVDLPPLTPGAARFQGIAVPDDLRGRWSLRNGSSRRMLPGMLPDLGGVDFFLHDSLHTRRNMLREFGLLWPILRPGGVVLADDVERNTAFSELRRREPALWRVVSDRETRPLHGNPAPVTFGLAVK